MFVMKAFNQFFTAFCIASTLVMVAYWMYKFELEDRDIGVVDYKSLQESDDTPFPVFSFCFNDILSRENLRNQDLSVDLDQYVAYLEGTFFNDTYAKMNYHDITINFDDFFLYGEAQWANESEYRNDTLTFYHKEVFSGRYFGGFFSKCFEVSSNIEYHRYVQDVNLSHNLTKLFIDLQRENLEITVNVHLLGQFLLAPSEPYVVSLHEDGLGKRQNIWIEEIELLKSRNSHSRICTPQNGLVSYDDMVSQKHIIRNGCTPPYFKLSRNVPPCNTREEIKKAMYIIFEARKKYIPVACDRFSKSRLLVSPYLEELEDDKTLVFYIRYPEYIKIITQSKEVDGHALIGNIAGYVGLILGKEF